MSTNFLYAQAPNRKGNISSRTPKHEAVSGGTSKLATPAGSQGAAKAGGNVFPVGNKMSLSKPKGYCGTIENDGYLKNSSYLK
jgi:hypothetical protein